MADNDVISSIDDAVGPGLTTSQIAQRSPPAVATPQTTAPSASGPANGSAPPAPAASGNDTGIVDPFKVEPIVAGQVKTLQSRDQGYDTMLNDFIGAANNLETQKDTVLGQTVAAKDAVNATLQDQTKNFQTQTQPLLQQRVNIADRQREIATMNPLKRSILGFFDNSYNPDKLNAVDSTIKDQIATRATQYQNGLATQDEILKTIDARYAGNADMIDQMLAHGQATITNAAHGVGSAQQMLQDSIAGIGAQTDVIRAQDLARQDTLANLDHGQVNQALAAAQKNGGTAIVNGVPLSEAALKTAGMNWSEKELSLSNLALSNKNQQMELTDRNESRMVSLMTMPEIQTAMQNGGVYQGQKISQIKLGSALASGLAARDASAQSAVTNTSAGIAMSGMQGISQSAARGEAQAKQLFGAVPPEMTQANALVAAKINALTVGAQEANKSGAGAAYWEKNLPELQRMQKQQSDMLTDAGKRWAGNNKDLVPLGIAVMTGQNLNSGSAADGFISMVRSGIKPPGMQGAALDAYNAAKGAVTAFDKGQGAQPVSMSALNMSPKQQRDLQQAALRTKVTDAISNQYNTNYMNQAIKIAPQVAAQIPGPNGQPHPFSKVSPQDWSTSQTVGDEKGYQRIAQTLGVSVDQAKSLFVPSDKTQQWWANHPKVDRTQTTQQLYAMQTQETLTALDHTASAANFPGGQAAASYVDLVNNPTYQQHTMNSVAGANGATPGDIFASAAAGNQFGSLMMTHGKVVAGAYSQLQAQNLSNAVDTSKRIRSIAPIDSTKIALGMVPGLSPQDQNSLLRAVIPIAKQQNAKNVAVNAVSASGNPSSAASGVTADAIDSVILHSKFQDPNLERIRKQAASQWATLHPGLRKGLAGLADMASDIWNADSKNLDAESAYTDYATSHPNFQGTGQ